MIPNQLFAVSFNCNNLIPMNNVASELHDSLIEEVQKEAIGEART